MPHFELFTLDGEFASCIATYDVADAEEVLALCMLRLEGCDLEIRRDDKLVARIARSGHVTRAVDCPGFVYAGGHRPAPGRGDSASN